MHTTHTSITYPNFIDLFLLPSLHLAFCKDNDATKCHNTSLVDLYLITNIFIVNPSPRCCLGTRPVDSKLAKCCFWLKQCHCNDMAWKGIANFCTAKTIEVFNCSMTLADRLLLICRVISMREVTGDLKRLKCTGGLQNFQIQTPVDPFPVEHCSQFIIFDIISSALHLRSDNNAAIEGNRYE